MSSEAPPPVMYCDLMEEVKARIALVKRVTAGDLQIIGDELYAYEIVALHLRKILELIAFGSLCANKDKYAEVHARFASHWKAKLLLQELERVHAEFYPQPMMPPIEKAPGHKFLPKLKDGFLTRAEFASLYDTCSEVLHTPNPFAERASVEFGRPIHEWLARIEALLRIHMMRLAGKPELWVVSLQEPDGRTRAFIASPNAQKT